jgi:hypothetical protein
VIGSIHAHGYTKGCKPEPDPCEGVVSPCGRRRGWIGRRDGGLREFPEYLKCVRVLWPTIVASGPPREPEPARRCPIRLDKLGQVQVSYPKFPLLRSCIATRPPIASLSRETSTPSAQWAGDGPAATPSGSPPHGWSPPSDPARQAASRSLTLPGVDPGGRQGLSPPRPSRWRGRGHRSCHGCSLRWRPR